MDNFFSSGEEQFSSTRLLLDRLEKAIENLTYISETDSEIVAFSTDGKNGEAPFGNLIAELGLPSDSPVVEREFGQFFGRLTRVFEGANERAKLSAERFAKLRELLDRNLKDIRVIVIGTVRVTIVVAGYDIEGAFTGVRTSAVET